MDGMGGCTAHCVKLTDLLYCSEGVLHVLYKSPDLKRFPSHITTLTKLGELTSKVHQIKACAKGECASVLAKHVVLCRPLFLTC